MVELIGLRQENYAVAKAFKDCIYWQPENRSLFDEHMDIELPYAPPGWLQNMKPSESRTHLDWLAATVSNWKWDEGTLYATNLPDIFWIFRYGEGDLAWGRHSGHFRSMFLTRLTIRDGKIVHIKDHFDNFLLYKALGIGLPIFDYEGPDPKDFPEWPPVPDLTDKPELRHKNEEKALRTFVNVEFTYVDCWDEEQCPIYAQNFVHRLPFTPANMPREYPDKNYDALNVWLQENTKSWDVHEGTVWYETSVDGEYIIESAGNGNMTWSHSGGAEYQNRHISWLKMENGYAVKYDEYFNPISKFNSIGKSVPTIPYLQGWRPVI